MRALEHFFDRHSRSPWGDQLGLRRGHCSVQIIRYWSAWRTCMAALTGLLCAARMTGRARGRFAAGSLRRIDLQLVQASPLFDDAWYLQTYPDVQRAGKDPLLHYMSDGWREGRDPGPEFRTSAYLKANADVARSGINPLLHYIEFGHAEGRATFGHSPLAHNIIAGGFDFPSPSPCASFPPPDDSSFAWRRGYRLDSSRPDSLSIGDCVVGYAADSPVQVTV